MASFAQPLTLAVRSVGPVANRILDREADGHVSAIFRSAIYVEAGGAPFCIGTAALEPGPINLITAAPAGLDWQETGLRQHEGVVLTPQELCIGARFRLPLRAAELWSPRPHSGAIHPEAIARGLAALRAGFCASPPGGGINRFIEPGHVPEARDREAQAAAAPVAEARTWLAYALARPAVAPPEAAWARELVGLGSGLTPSGDDFLGGMMIGLHAVGRAETGILLWRAIQPSAAQATNAISRALLGAASEGLGSESLLAATAAILRGDVPGVRACIPRISRIGHSSGWDAMTGIVAACECWLQSQKADAA